MSICIVCNKNFFNKRNANAKTCSRSCNATNHNKVMAQKFQTPICEVCGKETKRTSRTQYCSLKCMYEARRKSGHWNWKGGFKKHSEGYVYEYVGIDHSILQHRAVMEKHLGRKLTLTEVVHHINGKKDDNRIENLLLLPNQSTHYMIHRLENTIGKITTVLSKSEELLGTPRQELINYLEGTISSLAKTLKSL